MVEYLISGGRRILDLLGLSGDGICARLQLSVGFSSTKTTPTFLLIVSNRTLLSNFNTVCLSICLFFKEVDIFKRN